MKVPSVTTGQTGKMWLSFIPVRAIPPMHSAPFIRKPKLEMLLMLLRIRMRGKDWCIIGNNAAFPSFLPSFLYPFPSLGQPRGYLSWRYYRYNTEMQRCPLQAFPGVSGQGGGLFLSIPYLFLLYPLWLILRGHVS